MIGLETEVLERVGTLFGVSYLLSIFVAHAVEMARKFAPKRPDGSSKVDGWIVPLVAFVAAAVVTTVILRPAGVTEAYDAVTVVIFATMGAVGGDAWIRKVMAILGKQPPPPEATFPSREMPTKPDVKGG